jgi:uncharacterized membrane protein YdjX (TVP38/TMEM64 family)
VKIEKYGKFFITFSILLGVIGVFFLLAFIVRPLYDPYFVEEILKRLGIWGPFILIFLQILQVLLAPVPGHFLGFISGIVYGPIFGTLYSMVGLTLGAYLAFRLSRYFGRPFVEKHVRGKTLEKYDSLLDKRGASILFLFFLLPGFPDDALAYLAGLSRIDGYSFIAAVFFGRLPGIVLVAVAGREWAQERIGLFLLITTFSILLIALLLKFRSRIEKLYSDIFKKRCRRES